VLADQEAAQYIAAPTAAFPTGSIMANHKSAEKQIRRNAERAAINGPRMSRIRTIVKRVELAIARCDQEGAKPALKAGQPEVSRGVSKGVLHRNTAARKLSRLSARVKAMS